MTVQMYSSSSVALYKTYVIFVLYNFTNVIGLPNKSDKNSGFIV